jgi:hypothetical protein
MSPVHANLIPIGRLARLEHNVKPQLAPQAKVGKLCKSAQARVMLTATKCGPTTGKTFPAPAQQVV